LIAVHEIVYNVFQNWHKWNGIDEINIDFPVSADLDTLVSFDEVDEASDVESLVSLPSLL